MTQPYLKDKEGAASAPVATVKRKPDDDNFDDLDAMAHDIASGDVRSIKAALQALISHIQSLDATQDNQPSVTAGLGTSTSPPLAAGEYTIQVEAFPPWLSADAPQAQQSTNQPVTQSAQTITAVADSSGSLASKYFTFYNLGNATEYYVWFTVNGVGTDPKPAALLGGAIVGIPVASVATNAANTVVAAAARLALTTYAATLPAGANFPTITGATTAIIVNQTVAGAASVAADGPTTSTGFTFGTVSTAGSFGYGSGLTISLIQTSGATITTLQPAAGPPSQTQKSLGAATTFTAAANDTVSVVLASSATLDQAPNAFKAIINLFQGPA